MVFTIEPMVNAGKPQVKELNDGWTVITQDHSLSAQWEHMVAVTDTGFELLTPWRRCGKLSRNLHKKFDNLSNFLCGFDYGCSERCSTK